jgi:putative hydroxymethylpyrimidine transporter CytX
MPAKGGRLSEQTPSWGIEPVPDRLRVLGALDHFLLWSSLGVSLLVIVVGALLVPALSLRDAIVAIVLGGIVGNLMLASAGLIGADARVPGMVLMRAPLGRLGSYAPTLLNALQCWGWATFELIIISAAASALSDDLFGVGAKWAWTLVFGAVAATLALLGPVSVVRRFIRRFAVWAVLASVAYLTWWSLSEANFSRLWHARPEGGITLWIGMDLVIAITVSWAPLIPDYTRFSLDRRGAFMGAGLGYFVAGTWMLLLGVFLVLTRGLSDPAQLPAAVVAAGLAAALALLAVTVDEADEAFANVYSSAVSLQNLVPRASQRGLVLAVSVAATIGALVIDLRNYQSFLLLLGAFFVPLLGVLLAHWLLNGAHYDRPDVFDTPTLRVELLLAWLVGFAVYQWIFPIGPGWWVNLVERVRPPTGGLDAIGSSIPSFVVAFALAAAAEVAARAVSRRAAPSRT